MSTGYVGIDVQFSRDCSYAVLDDELKPHDSGWLAEPEDALAIVNGLRERFERVTIGIDVPRCPQLEEVLLRTRVFRSGV